MRICHLDCNAAVSQLIANRAEFANFEVKELSLPITASGFEIDLLVVGPTSKQKLHLAATVSDWKLPPVTLLILPEDRYADLSEQLAYHPRVGRCIIYCRDTEEDIGRGLEKIYRFHEKRASTEIDNSISGSFCQNNVSPRWLFHTIMKHLDEYIYFKDADSRFLAVSQYLVEKCGETDPSEVLGRNDFDFFERAHAEEAYADERRIASGEIDEIHKEEKIRHNKRDLWVSSRKLPLRTRSNFLAGSYGLSRDITEEKELHAALEKNHAHMQSELILARNLQQTLLQHNQPAFLDQNGQPFLEVATKYIPSFHLSGDFFSIAKTVEGGAAIMIADVMGHGVRAAMVTAMIQMAVNQLSDYYTQPADFLKRLNTIIHSTIKPSGHTIFATAAFGYLEPGGEKFTYAQAGARHGIYVPSDSARTPHTFEKKSTGPALGLIPSSTYPEKAIDLQTGDRIVFYTDGILEASQNGEEYGEDRIIEFLANHREDDLEGMINALLTDVYRFTKNRRLDDDVCMVALKLPQQS